MPIRPDEAADMGEVQGRRGGGDRGKGEFVLPSKGAVVLSYEKFYTCGRTPGSTTSSDFSQENPAI